MTINPTQAAILGLLHSSPMTGGDINAIADKWLTPYWNMTRSQVYRDIPTLADRGYIQPAKEYGPRNSLEYKITAAGKKAFQRWLNQEPAPELMRNESMLRVSLGALHKGESLQELLIWMRNYHELRIDEVKGLLIEARSEGMDFDEQALKFSLMYHQMMIGWLETVELPE